MVIVRPSVTNPPPFPPPRPFPPSTPLSTPQAVSAIHPPFRTSTPLPYSHPFFPHGHERTRTHTARSTRRSRSPHDLAALCSVLSPRRVGRIRPHSDGNRAAPKGHGSRSPTSQPLRARSQLRGRCARMYRARIARQDRAGRATLTAKSRLAPTANEAAPRDRSAIAQRVGAPAQTRARAAATRRRAWLQSALRDAEPRPRSRLGGASRVVPLVMPIRLV